MRYLACSSILILLLSACAEDAPTPRPPRTDASSDIGAFDVPDSVDQPDAEPDTPDALPEIDAEPDAEPDVQEDPEPDIEPDVEPDVEPDIERDLPPPSVDWCRLQSPAHFEGTLGASLTVLGRVRASGITDRTEATDADAAIEAEVGFGSAEFDTSEWTWIPAEPDATWADPASAADQYSAELAVPSTGESRIAYRFRRGGDGNWGDWTLCDLSRGAGRDGSEDGFALEDAGVVRGLGPCDIENVCGSAPLSECADPDTLRSFADTPTCEVVGGAAACNFAPIETECPARTECVGGACVSDSVTINWCRLDSPVSLELSPETAFPAAASIRVVGLTDRTTSVDVDERLAVDLGIGPVGSDVSSPAWRWTAGEPDADWTNSGGVDRWEANLSGVGVGSWVAAARVSGDRGESFTYCDTNSGEGSDGSEDGFDPADAGQIEVFVRVDPCAPNPCVAEPVARCDGDAVRVSDAEGECAVADAAAECSYEESLVEDCGAAGFRCEGARCVSGVRAPEAGELVITEIMAVTDGDIWFELTSVSDETVNLDGCAFLGSSGTTDISRPVLIEAGERFVFASGESTVDADFVIPSLSGGDAGFVYLSCDDATVDSMSWEADQITSNTALQLDSDSTDTETNDLGVRWCVASDEYAPSYFGSPGEPNATCTLPSVPIEWCRLQWPLSITGNVGATENVYGRVYGEGVTDISPGTDENDLVLAQAGFGPEESTPGEDWTWFDAIGNVGWDDELEPGNDEYEATLRLNEAGTFDYAFRFSGDLGATWTLCDLEATSDGSEDGYSPEDAGEMTVAPAVDPCEPNPCTVDQAPSCDGDVSSVVQSAGVCSDFGGATCDYTPIEETCEPGLCVGGVCQLAPAVGPPWCRLQWPSTMTLAEGSTGDVYARVFASGVTDASRGVDRYPALIGEVGVGPVGVDPSESSLAFEWFEMSANEGYDDAASGEPNNDEYEVSISVDAAGAYSYVARITGDSRSTWVYCDLGPSGSADGFSSANVGELTVTSVE